MSSKKFISVCDTQFMQNGSPYVFVGTNFWYGAYLGAFDRARLIYELDILKSCGITNLRIMGSSDSADFQMVVSPPFQSAPGDFNEDLLAGLDYLLCEMSRRGMTAVIFFTNFWQWSGGLSQYVSWATGEPLYDPDVEGNHLGGLMDMSARAYKISECGVIFRNVIKALVCRFNSYSNIYYKNDPTIMSWELANEPRLGSWLHGKDNYAFLKNWINENCSFIKSLDPNHLVTTGTEGSWGLLDDPEIFKSCHDVPSVDYLTFHLWLKNWGWFDIHNPEDTYAKAMDNAKKYIDSQIQIAKELKRPTVLEEFGIERDDAVYSAQSSTRWRDKGYRELFCYIEELVLEGAPIGGSNFWAWGGLGRASNEDYRWRKSDQFTGDPPQEPQGLNSVFDCDVSTLGIISTHAARLRNFCNENDPDGCLDVGLC